MSREPIKWYDHNAADIPPFVKALAEARRLAVREGYPNARGLAFVLFEGPNALVDWGISELRRSGRHERCLKLVELLLEKHRPDVLVVRDMPDGKNAELARQFIELAEREGKPHRCYDPLAESRRVDEGFRSRGGSPADDAVAGMPR